MIIIPLVFQALKVLRTADFSPLVMFISAPTVQSYHEVEPSVADQNTSNNKLKHVGLSQKETVENSHVLVAFLAIDCWNTDRIMFIIKNQKVDQWNVFVLWKPHMFVVCGFGCRVPVGIMCLCILWFSPRSSFIPTYLPAFSPAYHFISFLFIGFYLSALLCYHLLSLLITVFSPKLEQRPKITHRS